METTTTTTDLGVAQIDDSKAYNELLPTLRRRLAAIKGPLFQTTAHGLFDAFLDALPIELRQHYTCRCCKEFVERYGGLVIIQDDGSITSVMWQPSEVPFLFAKAVSALRHLVERSAVEGVFYPDTAGLGTESNVAQGEKYRGRTWYHMFVDVPEAFRYRTTPLKSASQAEAEKREDRKMLQHALLEYPKDVAVQALSLLSSGNLARSEKAVGIAKWFVEVHESLKISKGGLYTAHLLWRAVATAPAGFAHIRSSMIGTLLDDIVAQLPFEQIKRKWDEKMNPLQYMRPQAAPSAGNIAQAEKIFAALKSSGSLERRYARLDEIEVIWKPRKVEDQVPSNGKLFDHLTPKGVTKTKSIAQPATTMTFEKFRRDVLPNAVELEANVHSRDLFIALLTATNFDAPPIIAWDRAERRNPFSWYVYSEAPLASQWNVIAGWVDVTAVSLLPFMWEGVVDHGNNGKGAVLVLKDCRDSGKSSIGLFPELLKSEYREVRSTLEAYSRAATLGGREEASACGLDLRAGKNWHRVVRVTDARGVVATYELDRWD